MRIIPGMLKIMTDFLPPAALGRIQPGQPARLRLEGFPWTQYGAVPATVASVASEVEVDHVSPATLVLRTAGLLSTGPGTSHDFPGSRGADR